MPKVINKRSYKLDRTQRVHERQKDNNLPKDYVGIVIGVSSPDRGFKGSVHDEERDYFKFLVYFPEQQLNRFVIPYSSSSYFYENVGWNEDSYKGITVVCTYTRAGLPIGDLRGIVDIGNIKGTKTMISRAKSAPDAPDINEYLVTENTPYNNAYDFNGGAFSGIMDPTASFLIDKSLGEG